MASKSLLVTLLFTLISQILAASRTTPPSGAIVVRAGTTTSGEFASLGAAISSLPNDGSARSIFIYPGTYAGQVDITRTGALTIYGYTSDTTTYTGNQAILTAAGNATTAGSDDASGTLRVHTNNFKMYNVNVKNTVGPGVQAIALSPDTLYANEGTQVYLKGYIEGAADFIFGREGSAYFGGNTIAVNGPGHITASGRESNDSGSYVFNQNTIVLASDAASGTSGNIFLGRPWADFAKVVFKNTVITAPMNKALWSEWSTATPNTDNILFGEYNTTGSGASGATRPSFATVLSATQAATYSISSAVGSGYTSWVDAAYIV
ncbi:pectinesterase [Roridomyces roridus]|uniref:pectinesterase n=1 Tax=Roridomyces roridus TaxID=1738132 RepID=A0AAD7BYN4_9AGAR|nr:pectinesterase [Roridomyces roridus]